MAPEEIHVQSVHGLKVLSSNEFSPCFPLLLRCLPSHCMVTDQIDHSEPRLSNIS